MAKIDFPVATVDGQVFNSSSGVKYTYVGTPPDGYWSAEINNSGGGGGVTQDLQSVTDEGSVTTNGAIFGAGNITLATDGSITAAGDVKIGGTSAAPNIALNEDGSVIAAKGALLGTNAEKNGHLLQVQGTRTDPTSRGSIYLRRGLNIGGLKTGFGLGTVSFGNQQGYEVGAIVAVAESDWFSGSLPTRLMFATTGDGETEAVEKMHLDKDGNLKLGGTLPSAPNIKLSANGSATFASVVTLRYGWMLRLMCQVWTGCNFSKVTMQTPI